MALAFLMLAAAATNAHMTGASSNYPTEPLARGGEYTVDYRGSFICPEAAASLSEGDILTFSIFNQEEFSWLTASEHNHTVEYADCTNMDDPGYLIFPGTITFTVAENAPAFQEFTLKTGAYGQNNEGSDFNATIAYEPDFTAPTALSFDAVGGGVTATIPLTSTANANSVFNFDVSSFTIDGEDASDGATAHIQETLAIETGIFTENGSSTSSVDLHFGVGSEGHEDHGGHDMDDMEHDHMDDSDDAMGAAWETAQVIVSITLAAEQDTAQVSEPYLVTLTFNNADVDHMEHDENHGAEDDDSNFLPGFEIAAAIAVLGALAALRRHI